jgi:hypothetical protein
MRVCSTCKESKPLSEFARKGNGHNWQCKPCKNEYTRRHYLDNTEKYKSKAGNQTRRLRAIKTNYLTTHPCVDCGESDPDVLDFDHVRGVKVCEIGAMVSKGVGLAVFLAEIDKCDIRCANCHRRITRKRERYGSVSQLAED